MIVKFNDVGCVKDVRLDDYSPNLVFPWSIECGDSASFFSLLLSGWRTQKKWISRESSVSNSVGNLEVAMMDGKFDLAFEDVVKGESICRKATLTVTEDIELMDFVLQFRFPKELFHTGLIAGDIIKHTNSNKYYQYPVEKALLKGDNYQIEVILGDIHASSKFNSVMYIRDYRDYWVIHSRLLPNVYGKEIIKLNTEWYNKSIPQWISNRLLQWQWLREMIWYRSERSPYPRWNLPFKIFRPNGYGLSSLIARQSISIESVCKFSRINK